MDAIGMPQVSGRGKGSLWDGFRYLADRPALGSLILLAGIMGFCGWPSQSLLPALAQRTLAENADGYSWMVSGTGFGALAGALTVAAFGSMARQRQFLRAGVGLISAALIGLSAVPNLPLAILSCAGIGFGLILFLATSQSIVQLSAGEHNRGRIMGIWAMVLSGAVPFGNLLFGPLADRWGEPVVLRIEGTAAISAALVIFLLLRSGRRQLANSANHLEQQVGI
jgi:MFS family permease